MSQASNPDPERPDRRVILGTLAGLAHFGFLYSARPAAAQKGGASTPPPPPNVDGPSFHPPPPAPSDPSQPPGQGCGSPGAGGWVTLDRNCGSATAGRGVSEDKACTKPVQTGFPQINDDKDCGIGTAKGLSEDSACSLLCSASPPTAWRDLNCGRPGGSSPDKDCGLPATATTFHIDNDCFLTHSDLLKK
jgi:hypothetical protein